MKKAHLRTLPCVLLAMLSSCLPLEAAAAPPAQGQVFARPDKSLHIESGIALGDGNLLLVGQVYDVRGRYTSWGWIAKTDANGRRVWEQEPGRNALNASLSQGVATGNGAGNGVAVLVGTVNEGVGVQATSRAWVVAVNADGRALWEQAFTLGKITHALNIAPAGRDGFLVVGAVIDASGDRAWIARIEGPGHTVAFKRVLDTPAPIIPTVVVPLPGGAFAVAGRITQGKATRAWVGRFDANGRREWGRLLDVKDGDVSAAALADNGDLVLAVNNGYEGPLRVLRMDATGAARQQMDTLGLCGRPVLWRGPGGRLQMAGQVCEAPLDRPQAGVVADVDRPNQWRRVNAVEGVQNTRLVALPGRAIGVVGASSDRDIETSVFVTRRLP